MVAVIRHRAHTNTLAPCCLLLGRQEAPFWLYLHVSSLVAEEQIGREGDNKKLCPIFYCHELKLNASSAFSDISLFNYFLFLIFSSSCFLICYCFPSPAISVAFSFTLLIHSLISRPCFAFPRPPAALSEINTSFSSCQF